MSAALLVGCATNNGNVSQQERTAQQTSSSVPEEPSGTVQIDFVQVAFIGSGAKGSGILTFQGKQYPFEVMGLGIGGLGAARVHATGEIYGLERWRILRAPMPKGELASRWQRPAKGGYG